MNKIKSFKNAQELVNKMLDDANVEIVLWDEMESNRIISVERDSEYSLWCWMRAVDTVNGTYESIHVYISDVAELVYDNRKDVNKLNDLASL